MPQPPSPPASPAERWAWLRAEQTRYWGEPSQAGDQLPATLALFEQLKREAPCDFGVALVAHLVCLLDEEFQGHTTGPFLAIGLGWTELGLGAPYRIYLLAKSCHLHAFIGEVEQAALLLARLTDLNAEAATAPEDRAHYQIALAACLCVKQETQREIECLLAASRLYQEAAYPGPWVVALTDLALAYRRQGDLERRLQASQAAVKFSVEQRRWAEACNALTGVAEAFLEMGDSGQAQQAVSSAGAYLACIGDYARQRFEPEVLAAQAKCCAASQDFAGAAQLMQQSIAGLATLQSKNAHHARRLRELAPWLMQTDDGQGALLALEQAHAWELDDLRLASQRALTMALEKAELHHAQIDREHAQAHAKALERQNQALSESLQLQHDLQDELIASSRLASLGSLLAGIAHELNTPLGVALTALSSLVARGQALEQRLQQGAVSRSGLQADVLALTTGGALSLSNVERALKLIATYKEIVAELPEPRLDLAAKEALATLVQAAWREALGPSSALSLQLDLAEPLSVASGVIHDVLVQLFQNVARHAYPPGQAGLVRVSAGRNGHQLWLSVQDQGRGIAADLLPRVFDPYVTTQFGQGRSGLGLFKAQAQVSKELKGRLSVKSAPGQGARFEIEWLQLELPAQEVPLLAQSPVP
ncbi:sensor histidine kinase [Paucibacter sp. KCTC 42545]|uniref:sensor histidine kinase n=1 Tax=Paucibacter sp. KCTC 42545 TaxID=1768242 RepID=UPI000733AA28|nr:HAMP domain-containing sensor histidine kinase [Paucibacter sp. KCTC 42545]ALT78405.1 hypothetical protein AT984_15650 [Paucibacter sp. KCTC 42545]